MPDLPGLPDIRQRGPQVLRSAMMAMLTETDEYDDFMAVALIDDGDGVNGNYLAAAFQSPEAIPPNLFAFQQGGVIATHTGWAPDDLAESQECWMIIAVVPGHAAACCVGPYDGGWTDVPHLELPWLFAGTAGGLRKALELGEPLHVKDARDGDPRLWDKVRNSNPPNVDEHGRI